MDSTYDIITKIVDVQSLNEAETASLVQKYTLAASVHHPEKCLYVQFSSRFWINQADEYPFFSSQVIMGAIWPSSVYVSFIFHFRTCL